MNRREVFTRLAGAAAIAGIPLAVEPSAVQTIDSPAEPHKALAVLRFDKQITPEHAQNLKAIWKHELEGTAWADVPLIVLSDGASIQVYDLNRVGVTVNGNPIPESGEAS